jgi:hypothetical protein
MRDKWVIWCGLNAEQDKLEKLFGKECVSVRGATPNDEKVRLEKSWRITDIPIMISKASVFGLGLNWQVCNKAAFVGLSDSWEQFYQAVRRIWRFGQDKKVDIHIFIEEREGAVLKNIQRKDKQAKTMIQAIVKYMQEITKKELGCSKRETIEYNPTKKMRLPAWIK